MSKYGIDYYGLAYYGPKNDVAYTTGAMLALPVDYGKVVVSWTTPSGMWDLMRLSRNPYGFPLTPDDGDVLFEDINGESRTFFPDDGTIPREDTLKPGHPYYYTLFVRQSASQTWVSAGTAIGIPIKDFNTLNNMINDLPAILTSEIPYDEAIDAQNSALVRFLKLFAVNYDLYKSQAENLMNRYDVENINGQLIPIFLEQFGSSYEPEIGLRQARVFLRNLTRLYQTKGSKAGVENYVKAFVGYDNDVVMGKNLFLSSDDSSFEQSAGHWEPVSGAPIFEVNGGASYGAPDYWQPYAEPESSYRFPNLRAGLLQLTEQDVAVIACGYSDPTMKGIPVIGGETYTFSYYHAKYGAVSGIPGVFPAYTAKSLGNIIWFDSNGVEITTVVTGSSVTASTTWGRVSRTAQAPVNAAYAVPSITVEIIDPINPGLTNHTLLIDACQFEKSATATTFEDARKIHINLVASRINELLNPNFEDSVDHWTVTNGHLILAGSEVTPPPGYIDTEPISGGAAELYADAAGQVTLTSQAMDVIPANDYTFSIYCASVVTGSNFAVTPYISWYDADDNLLGTDTGTPVTTGAEYQRPYVTASSPVDAAYAGVGVFFTGTSATDEIAIDAALFERSSGLNTFFDGNHGFAEQSDVLWEGGNLISTINHARSHYYKNRYSSQERLVGTLDNWITLGSTFELYFALPS